MGSLIIPGSVGQVSDGYHTFDELYEHRCLLLIALANTSTSLKAWKSRKHEDGSAFDGWFIAGLDLPTGPITYHLPDRLWSLLTVPELESAPAWDGHTSQNVLERLTQWLNANLQAG